ncbi:zinc finger CCCH domain-containing protein 57 [Acanthopagrus latus]|uniref:zinc finger CCCH domain-containing protein 57 n=1 Tax=Acanthopagrus latus TaxID=8177 RepID=UPI00187C2556|nr:zinc finger CCCH domain-containing protein 57 [Acanthopagrus latus]
MNSLVGYGVSSDSDSDGDAEDVNNGGVSSSSSVKELSDEAPGDKRTRNFLLETGSASSDSEPEEDDPEPSSSPPPPPHLHTPASSAARQSTLPPPSLGSLNPNKLPPPSLNTCSDSSVFANPFKAQADQKLSALQKHVPLTLQAQPSQIGGKRMCVSYRKDGRCRFGIKCKFAHDSDLQTPVTPTDCHPAVSEDLSDPDESHAGDSCVRGQETTEEESGGQQAKKRRVGLSNTLIPPKRAMKQFSMQRDRERVNMS